VNEQNFEAMRQAMVSNQLRTNAVSDPRIVAAMRNVPREKFVPGDRHALAYVDIAIPLTGARSMNVPMATGRLLNEGAIAADDTVLIVGAATGYSAAVAAELAACVVAVEDDDELFDVARTALADIPNVLLIQAPLSQGSPEHGPYDLILIDGTVEQVPDSLIAQLKPGGRMATGLREGGVSRLATGRRAGTGFGLTAFAEADCVALPGFDRPKTFRF
jgi:protein-L-isoaspartate(D-aspartate) O-methyltransferase